MSKPLVDTSGNKYTWIDSRSQQSYVIYAKTKEKAYSELVKLLRKTDQILALEHLEAK